MRRGEQLLATWLEYGGEPPIELEMDVVEAVWILRPALVAAPQVDVDALFEAASRPTARAPDPG